jgi:hypothetical protein
MRSPCCLSVYPSVSVHLFVCPSPNFEAYEIILLSLCSPPPQFFFVFYAVRVVLNESRRLVLPRTSCYVYVICPLLNVHKLN